MAHESVMSRKSSMMLTTFERGEVKAFSQEDIVVLFAISSHSFVDFEFDVVISQ